MNQQRKCSSYGETASVGSTKSIRSNNSSSAGDTLSKKGSLNGLLSRQGSQDSGGGGGSGSNCGGAAGGAANWPNHNNNNTSGVATSGSILNVAEMLLHGVADHEIFDIWLRSINCQEFINKFIESGYDMPTLSRITPQDLAAIGVTEPAKRLKILTEIKKLNLQDGIPNFRPTSLNHWLNLIKLDQFYYQSLCDQSIDSIDKMCQLTWEDFEELGITKLGHQKRIQLAIERLKGLEKEGDNGSLKTITEPIYDTNPSQILLVASSENHSMNGPIINKQASSTSELSSTGSGSMHSVYSAASAHYSQSQLTPTPQPQAQQSIPQLQQQPLQQASQPPSNQAIHVNSLNQPTASPYHQQPMQMHFQANQMHHVTQVPSQPQQHHQQHPPQQQQQQLLQQQFLQQSIYSQPQTIYQQPNRQSLGQIPPQLIKLANLPKHQQQILQQSSIYATLGRHHPAKNKQPPPVPIRTNSLKSNSLTDDNYIMSNRKQNDQPPQFHNTTFGDQDHLSMLDQYYQHQSHVQSSNHCANAPTSNISGGSNLTRHNTTTATTKTHAVLTKNKSFSGNTHMEVSRARFLNRNSQQPNQQIAQLSPHPNNGALVRQHQSQHQHQQHQRQYQQHQHQHNLNGVATNDTQCNFTTGKDDEFPPPPSPLSLAELEVNNDMVSSTSSDNFDRINHGLMAFRVGI